MKFKEYVPASHSTWFSYNESCRLKEAYMDVVRQLVYVGLGILAALLSYIVLVYVETMV